MSLAEGEHYRSALYIAFVAAAHRVVWPNVLLDGAARHADWRSVQSIMFVGTEYHVCGRRVSCLWAQSTMFVGAEYHVCWRRLSCLWAQSITFVGAE